MTVRVDDHHTWDVGIVSRQTTLAADTQEPPEPPQPRLEVEQKGQPRLTAKVYPIGDRPVRVEVEGEWVAAVEELLRLIGSGRGNTDDVTTLTRDVWMSRRQLRKHVKTGCSAVVPGEDDNRRYLDGISEPDDRTIRSLELDIGEVRRIVHGDRLSTGREVSGSQPWGTVLATWRLRLATPNAEEPPGEDGSSAFGMVWLSQALRRP